MGRSGGALMSEGDSCRSPNTPPAHNRSLMALLDLLLVVNLIEHCQ